MKPWPYITTHEDTEFSESEELAIQLKKMDKNDPEYSVVQEEYWEALENEYEELFGVNFSEMLKKVME